MTCFFFLIPQMNLWRMGLRFEKRMSSTNGQTKPRWRNPKWIQPKWIQKWLNNLWIGLQRANLQFILGHLVTLVVLRYEKNRRCRRKNEALQTVWTLLNSKPIHYKGMISWSNDTWKSYFFPDLNQSVVTCSVHTFWVLATQKYIVKVASLVFYYHMINYTVNKWSRWK